MKTKLKNKKGNIFLGITICLFLWAMGVLFMPFILDDVDTFRTAMECTSTSISYGSMFACLFVDALVPYYIWFFASLAIGYLVGAGR
jgi:hypothetical protein